MRCLQHVEWLRALALHGIALVWCGVQVVQHVNAQTMHTTGDRNGDLTVDSCAEGYINYPDCVPGPCIANFASAENLGSDCWADCDETQGPCSWCGASHWWGYCCSFGGSNIDEHCDGTSGIPGSGGVHRCSPGLGYVNYAGWPSDVALLSTETSPCNRTTFVAALSPGEGYYWDPLSSGDGWCKSISSNNVAAVRAAHISGNWVDGSQQGS
eukprot:SAG11_NODE_12630_length_694_cov_0.695798_1_plen_211_part_01